MKWTHRLFILVLVGLPAFTGITPFEGLGEVMPGVAWSGWIYALVVNMAVGLVCGAAFGFNALTVAALIMLPVVFAGASISWLLGGMALADPRTVGIHGAHYVRLALNMLGVIPLALGIVAVIPFQQFEQRLLQDPRGVTGLERRLLMAVRVFNHVLFSVIPAIFEIVREERLLERGVGAPGEGRFLKAVGRLSAVLVQISVAGICGALRFIPLWAQEIAALPERRKADNRRSP